LAVNHLGMERIACEVFELYVEDEFGERIDDGWTKLVGDIICNQESLVDADLPLNASIGHLKSS
jgi:hypothetical protein